MSYLSYAKRIVKQTKFGSQLMSIFPKRITYGSLYPQIVQLYKWRESNENTRIEEFMRARMVLTLNNALKNVPWYAKNVTIDPLSININNVYDKLMQFPYTDKKTVMDNWQDFQNVNIPKAKLKFGSTEGTTGQGVVISGTFNDTIVSKIFFEQDLKTIRYDFLKSKILRIGLDALKKEDEYPIEIRGNRCFVSPIHLNEKWMPEIVKKTYEYHPEVIHSYPSLLYQYASYIVDNNIEPLKVKCLFLASDTFLYHHYLTFKKAFPDAMIYCIYGMSERVLLGVAKIDEEHQSIGYQLNPFFGYAENFRNTDGNYELVGTGYWMEAMPFIRYKTNDFGKINSTGYIEKLEGRGNSYLTTKKGYKIAGISVLSFEDYYWDYIKSIQLIQKQHGDLILRVVPKENYNPEIGCRMISDMEKIWPGLFDYSIETADTPIKGRSLKANSIIVES